MTNPIKIEAYPYSQLEDETSNQSQSSPNTKSSYWQVCINFFKASVGSGILGFPFVYNLNGIFQSIIVSAFIMCSIGYAMVLIDEICEHLKTKYKELTFEVVYREAFGAIGIKIYVFFLLFLQLGVCMSYIIFFINIFEQFLGLENTIVNRLIFIIISEVVIVPLMFIDLYHLFYSWSSIANILILVSIGSIFEYDIERIIERIASETFFSSLKLFDLKQLPTYFGVAFFACENIGSFFVTRDSMADKSKFKSLICFVTAFAGIVYTAFGVLTSMALGDEAQEIVFLGIEKQRSYFKFFQIAYSVALLISFALQFYPVTDLLNQLFPQIKTTNSKLVRYMPRMAILFILQLIPLLLPSFLILVNFAGSFAGLTLGFVFPFVAYQITFKGQISRAKLILINTIFVFGFLGCATNIIYNIKDVIKLFQS